MRTTAVPAGTSADGSDGAEPRIRSIAVASPSDAAVGGEGGATRSAGAAIGGKCGSGISPWARFFTAACAARCACAGRVSVFV